MSEINHIEESCSADSQSEACINNMTVHLEQATRMPKCSLMRTAPKLKLEAERIFKLSETWEQPFQTYYLVFTPARNKKGIKLSEFKTFVKKKYGGERCVITREVRSSDGRPVYPHYNVLLTTKKPPTSYSNYNYNCKVQSCPYVKDIKRVWSYIWKEYESYRPCISKRTDVFYFHK